MQVEARKTVASAGQYDAERRYPRHFLSAPVSTWRLLSSGPQVTRGLTLEISMGGVSAVLCGPPQVGERVSVRMKLLDAAFEAPAIVRHSSPSRTGFEFLDPLPKFLRGIEACTQGSLLWPWSEPYGIKVMSARFPRNCALNGCTFGTPQLHPRLENFQKAVIILSRQEGIINGNYLVSSRRFDLRRQFLAGGAAAGRDIHP